MTGYQQHLRGFDAPERKAYVNALFIIGTLGTLIAPALLEAWAKLHWTQGQLGFVAGIELAGLAVGSLSGLYWQRRWNWRHVALGALLVAVIANASCTVLDDFVSVCIARGAVGLAGGFLCGVYSAFLANIKSPGRMIAVTTFIQIAVEAVFLFSTTSVFDRLGSSGLFVLMAALLAILIPFLRVLPLRWPTAAPSSTRATGFETRSWRGYPLLLSFVPFVLVQTGVYTFLAEFGQLAAHLTVEQALRAIGISVVLSSLGSVAAYVLNDRAGLLLPIGAATTVMIATMCAMILGSRSAPMFLGYISLLQIAWIFLNCYLYSALIDANNLLVPAATPLSSFGSALGASAMGYVLQHGGLIGSLWLAVGALGLTALLTTPFLAPLRHRKTTPAPASPARQPPLPPAAPH
jgi:DHA1 family inner membrane transport protein